ncbi:MAG: hypothetical protein KGM47_12525, partial [Acidobacteriota bacterium]|nr:hypothetical protein [Acidobacteriota bacterium]
SPKTIFGLVEAPAPFVAPFSGWPMAHLVSGSAPSFDLDSALAANPVLILAPGARHCATIPHNPPQERPPAATDNLPFEAGELQGHLGFFLHEHFRLKVTTPPVMVGGRQIVLDSRRP